MLDNPALTQLVTAALQGAQNQIPAKLDTITTYPHANNTLDINAIAHYSGNNFPIAFTFSPIVDPATGVIKIRLVSVQLGKLPLPNLEQTVESAIDDQLAGYGNGSLSLGLAYHIIDARVTDKALVITASIKTGQ